MTNSTPSKPKPTTGTEARITEDAAKFVSQRGTEFVVDQAPNGLYFIRMAKGGTAPQFCHEFYTGRGEAEKVLTRYLRVGDKLGYAKFPDKDK